MITHRSNHPPVRRTSAVQLILLSLLGLLALSMSHGATLVIMQGDDDGFGGTQGASSQHGDPFGVFNSPSIAPGTWFGESGTDVATESPWTAYSFNLPFFWDTSSLQTITSAAVSIQTGSLGRRTNNTGYGYAAVSLNGNVIGPLLSVSTGSAGSPEEESVRLLTFDATPFIAAGQTGTLTVLIDGSSLISPNPVDQFALDFARLEINGDPVPEPGSVFLLPLAALLLWRRVKA